MTAGLPWCGRSPRDWQVAALSTFREASASGRLHGGVFAACTGSGKSIHLAEVVADLSGSLSGSDVIVVTTPTVALVDQLSATIAERLGSPVGVYYTHGKSLTGPVIVTCHPSFGDCLAALSAAGRRVAFWCADEAHRTDNPQILTPAAKVDGVPRVGWSATPYKSNPDANSGLTLWQHELARYGIDDAIADGALVGWSATGLGAFDVQRVNDLAAAADRLPPDDPDREEIALEQQEIIDAASVRWVSRQSGPGVVSALHVIDAERFAKRLEDAGVRAMAIHSNQPQKVRAARIEALQQGSLDCLVHVQILTEGVDLPWLRWGCLRRRRNRVGFVQEVGRFLRAWPGKTVADLFDPLGLFVAHGIDHPSQLGGVTEVVEVVIDETDAEAAATLELVDPITGRTYRVPRESKARSAVQTIAVAHAVSTSFVSDCVSALRADGMLQASPGQGKGWRQQPASDRQLQRLEFGAKRYTWLKRRPEPVAKAVAYAFDLLLAEHRACVKAGVGTTLRRGVLSDFIDLDVLLTPRKVDSGFDLSAQDAAIRALSRWVLDNEGVAVAAREAAQARREVDNG